MNQNAKKEKLELTSQLRTKMGKANRKMRKDGLTPGNIYGKDFNSISISINTIEFEKIFKTAGETTVVYLDVDGKNYPTLISDIQYHPVTDKILHIDFRKVNLKQKIEAMVPLKFSGESELVRSKEGILLEQMDEVTVLALPNDIPQFIEVDTSILNEFGATIKVSDLPKSEEYEIKEDSESIIASLTEHKEEELTAETTIEQPEIITEKATDESAGASTSGSEQKSE
jgi:large subunit ribosomal protein L25